MVYNKKRAAKYRYRKKIKKFQDKVSEALENCNAMLRLSDSESSSEQYSDNASISDEIEESEDDILDMEQSSHQEQPEVQQLIEWIVTDKIYNYCNKIHCKNVFSY